MELQKIDFLKNATDFTDVVGGYSGAFKKYFKKDGKKYFVKIGDFQVRKDLELLLSRAEIPHPKIVESGFFDEGNNYIIEEFLEGVPFKEKLNEYNTKFIYEFGFKLGEKYRNLRKFFPDKCVDDKTYNNFINKKNACLKTLQTNLKKYYNKLSSEEIDFLPCIKNFLTKNCKLIKDSILVFGHTDVKPSNFFVNDNDIFAIDFQSTEYKELSQSIIWSYARSDFKDEKNLAFTRGYLDGLFNFCIPQGFLKCCNYSYLLNICEIFNKCFEKEDFNKIYQLISHVKNNYLKEGKVCIDKYLNKLQLIDKIPCLKDFEINLIKGSYSPHNLTFKCTKGNKKYFLKVMERSKSVNIKQCQKSYKVMEDLKIPTSPVRYFGKLDSYKIFYFIFDFVEYEEMKNFSTSPSFDEGERLGYLTAKELIKLKDYKLNKFKSITKIDIYKNLKKDVSFIFKNKKENILLNFKKQEILDYIDKLLKNFDSEPISLTHGDVKFGNILYNGKNLIFVDNEHLAFSYDIMNFYHNILSKFNDDNLLLHQGFLTGYLKYMKNGKIPSRIHGQVRLLLLARLLKEVKDVMNKIRSDKKIPLLNKLCQQYVKNNEEIKWLK